MRVPRDSRLASWRRVVCMERGGEEGRGAGRGGGDASVAREANEGCNSYLSSAGLPKVIRYTVPRDLKSSLKRCNIGVVVYNF